MSCSPSNHEASVSTANEPLAKLKTSVINYDSLKYDVAVSDSINSIPKKIINSKKNEKIMHERYCCMLMLNGEPSRYELNLSENIYNLKSDTIPIILNQFYYQNESSFPTSIACNFEDGTSTVHIEYPTVHFKVYLFENKFAEKPYKIVDYSIYSESDKRKNKIAFDKLNPVYDLSSLTDWNSKQPTVSSDKIDVNSYLIENSITPEKVKELGISGTSWLTFIVEKDGSVSEIRIEKEFQECKECDEEALRVAKSLPILNPGQFKGEPVRVRVQQGINFPR